MKRNFWGINIHSLYRPGESHGKRELERKSVWGSLREMGQGVVTGEEPPTLYHRALSHAVWLAHGCGTATLHRVSSPGCAAREQQSRGEGSVRITDSSFHDWSHGDWRLIQVDTQLSKSWHTTLQRAKPVVMRAVVSVTPTKVRVCSMFQWWITEPCKTLWVSSSTHFTSYN